MGWHPERLIAWHYERCGSIEHVIDILKNDLGGGQFLCGTFGANAALWRITCITHNLIQALKIIALPFSWFYMRMKKLRFRLFCIAGRIISHARQTYLQLARGHPVLPIYRQARARLAVFAIYRGVNHVDRGLVEGCVQNAHFGPRDSVDGIVDAAGIPKKRKNDEK